MGNGLHPLDLAFLSTQKALISGITKPASEIQVMRAIEMETEIERFAEPKLPTTTKCQSSSSKVLRTLEVSTICPSGIRSLKKSMTGKAKHHLGEWKSNHEVEFCNEEMVNHEEMLATAMESQWYSSSLYLEVTSSSCMITWKGDKST